MPPMLGRLCRQSRVHVIGVLQSPPSQSRIAVIWRCAGRVGHRIITMWRHNRVYTRVGRCVVARKRKPDAKEAALAETRTLNPRPEAVRDEQFASSEFFDARDVMQVKYEMVRRVRVDGVPIARSAAAFGFSRPSFYQAAAAVDAHGLAGLVPARPGPKRAHKLTDEIVTFARRAREDDPVLRSTDLVELIADRFGISVHPRSVERALA